MRNELERLVSDFKSENKDVEASEIFLQKLTAFIEHHQNVTTASDKNVLVDALVLQITLYRHLNQDEKAQAVEQLLADKFENAHLIGVSGDEGHDSIATSALNFTQEQIDTERLKMFLPQGDIQLEVRRKKAGVKLKVFSFLLILVASYWFSIGGLWLPIIVLVVSALSFLMGQSFARIHNEGMAEAALENGLLIPAMVVDKNEDEYHVLCVAPLDTSELAEDQQRFGLKTITLKRTIGDFEVNDKLASVSVFDESKGGYYSAFYPFPICCATTSELPLLRAVDMVEADEWKRIEQLAPRYKTINAPIVVVDNRLAEITG